MSIKRYAAHTNIDDFKSDWHESKDGPMVKYSDYSALEQQLTALTSQLESVVAENAALKQSELEYDATCREEFGSDWVTELTETPATAEFLAEVRASGVEMLAEHLSGMSISASETSVREFAAQLRQGGAE